MDRFDGGLTPWRRASIAGLLALALLIVLAVLNFQAAADRRRAADWQMHTFNVLLNAERLTARLSDLQRGQRGYLLTGDDRYLDSYREQVTAIPSIQKELLRLTNDNGRQRGRLMALGGAIVRLHGELQQEIAVVQRGGAARPTVPAISPGSEAAARQVRAVLAAFTAEETQLLAERQTIWFAATNRSNMFSFVIAGAALAVMLIAIFLTRTAAIAAVRARRATVEARALALTREQLQTAVDERTSELATANAGLRAQIERAQSAESQVRQLQKLDAVGQLTGGIAHDFNNMLAIVLGSLDLAQRRLGDGVDPRVLTLIANAIEGAKRAAALTARLLAFSRQQPLAPEPVDANKFVTGMSEMLQRTIGENVEVETVLAGGLWRTYADASQLESAIINLAVNARDAMPGGGKVTIETANTHLDDSYAASHADVLPGQYVAICVTDTGTGMTPEVIERAFDPFYTTKGVGKGSGLGLSQVFGFVKQSGGHLKIYSELDHGTTVKIYLPRWFGADAIKKVVADDLALPRAVVGDVVMVVDDEQYVRHMSVDALTELGYTVLEAKNGEDALRLLSDRPLLNLLFTDIVMPGMNGRVLAEQAKALRPDLKILYTTGYTRNAVVHNGMLDSDVAFLPKPFTLQQLAVKVRQVLDGGGVNRPV